MFPGAVIAPSPVQADALGVGREGGVARDVALQHVQRVLLEALQGGRQRRSIPDCLLTQLRVLPVWKQQGGGERRLCGFFRNQGGW